MVSRFFAYFSVALVFFPCALFGSPDLGVQAQSLGGAYRAVATSNDIIFYNPAGILVNRRISSDIDYKLSTDNQRHRSSVSVVDSKTTSWGLALAYSVEVDPKSNGASNHLAYFSVAMPIISDMLLLGTSVSYHYDPSPKKEPYKHFFNMDAALMACLPTGVRFAIALDHLIDKKGSEKPLGLSLGAAFELSKIIENIPLTIAFDWLMDDLKSDDNQKHEIAVGGQYLAFGLVPIRIGFKSDISKRDQYLSMGSGFIVPGISVDALYQQHLAIGKIRQFGLALRLDF